MKSLAKQSKFHAAYNKMMGVAAGTSAMLMGMTTAYASNPFGNAETSIKNLFDFLRSTLTNVATPIAGAAFIFCLIMTAIAQDQKQVEKYRSWAMRIFIGVVGVYAVDFVIKLAETIGKSF